MSIASPFLGTKILWLSGAKATPWNKVSAGAARGMFAGRSVSSGVLTAGQLGRGFVGHNACGKQSKPKSKAQTTRLAAEAEAQTLCIITEAEIEAIGRRQEAAGVHAQHPGVLRLPVSEILRKWARTANAWITIGLVKHMSQTRDGSAPDP